MKFAADLTSLVYGCMLVVMVIASLNLTLLMSALHPQATKH